MRGVTHVICRAVLGLLSALAVAHPSAASSVQTAYTFDPTRDGSGPISVIAAPDGRLFGMLARGPNGRGVIFELDPPATVGLKWTERTIFTFPIGNGFNEGSDINQILLGRRGDLFFTTQRSLPMSGSASVLWQLSPPAQGSSNWTAAVRANNPQVGGVPLQSLSLQYLDSSNVIYGFAWATAGQAATNAVVVRLAPLSTDPSVYLSRILAPVAGPNEEEGEGGNYFTRLLLGADGSFYGSNAAGLFSVKPPATAGAAWTRTSLPAYAPNSVLATADRSLDLYTVNGQIGKFTPFSPNRTILFAFNTQPYASDGDGATSLVQDRSALLFGAAVPSGLSRGLGFVFRIGPNPPVYPTVLLRFSGPDGAFPFGLTTLSRPDGSRTFFGLTSSGGQGWTGNDASGAGTVFQINP